MIQKNLDAVVKKDIDSLIANKVRESRTIEYKKSLIGNSDDDKKEFLADVSSFANGSGGDIIYGITAINGIPISAEGLSVDHDAEILRLESIIRDGIEPRIQGIHIRAIEGFTAGAVITIRIPKSWSAPHMVTFKNHSRFFTRNSAGKYQMDVTEIRSSFLYSEALPERIKRFRDERIGRIIADETPVALQNKERLVMHILPLVSFSSGFKLDGATLKRNSARLSPLGPGGCNHRINLDGLVTNTNDQKDGKYSGYCLFFRSGQIESVSSDFLKNHLSPRSIPSIEIEKIIIKAVDKYLLTLKELEVPFPVIIFLGMIGVSGVVMSGVSRRFSSGCSIDRDVLLFPDVIVTEDDLLGDFQRTAKILRPAFDAIWNACGYEQSYNYDEDGNWKAE